MIFENNHEIQDGRQMEFLRRIKCNNQYLCVLSSFYLVSESYIVLACADMFKTIIRTL